MKFSILRQLIPVLSIGLLVATLLTACSLTTIDYVFVASSSGIDTFAVDSQSGALRAGAPRVTAGVSSPVAMTTSSDYANLYLANAGNNSIVHYAIGLNGVLTQKESASANPVAIAANTAGTYLYAAAIGNALTSGGPAQAELNEYTLSSGAIGSVAYSVPLTVPGYTNDTIVPTGVTVLANNGSNILGDAVYVSAYDQSAYNPGGNTTSNANPGWVFGFTIGSGGALTAITNSPWQAGVKPTAIASDPTDRFVYVTDYASNELIGYTVLDGSNLAFMTAGPFKTGNEPNAIVIDPRGYYIYVTNALDSTVSAYSIVQATGNPTGVVNVVGSPFNSTDTQPVAITVDPALGRFVYTANHLGDSVSGFRLNPASGAMSPTQATPYPTGANPTAIVCIPHGNHATQVVTP
ncbi:MAG: beta-propeller fold lactonase family protein [Terracidiphilus sp.]|jgi:6-phosphogluconolactonase (cycloisomerase 2 family)